MIDRLMAAAKNGQIRGLILLPLSVSIGILLLSGLVGVYWIVETANQDSTTHILEATQNFFRYDIRDDTEVMDVAVEGILHDPAFLSAMRDNDRAQLRQYIQPIFESLHNEHLVTTLTITDPNGVTTLRAHSPDHFGDPTNHLILQKAIQTGKNASGIAMGSSGALSLRTAMPVRADDALLGYIELGSEIGEVIDHLHDALGIDLVVLVDKRLLDTAAWERGKAKYGWSEPWDRFPQVVLTRHTMPNIPSRLQTRILKASASGDIVPGYFSFDHHVYYAAPVPLADQDGQRLGSLIVIADRTDALHRSRRVMIIFSLLCLVIGAALVQIFNRLLGSVEQRVRIAIAQQAQATAELERVAHVATQHMRSPAQQIVQLTQNLRDRSQERLSPEDVAELGLIIAHTQEMRDNMEALEDYMDLGLNAQVKSVSLDAVLIAAKRQLQLATAVETTGALPTIIGYPVLLARLFFYLLEQAVSSRDPHRPLRLEVGATQLGDGWRLSFADNGIALEERCENSLIQENIRRIAQLHGGGMDASSNAEGGVTTSITLGATPQTR